jgi:glycosyltransferase involved in cell wall biosynthesis
MRALILGRSLADPADRGKLRALAGQGLELTVLVPDLSGALARTHFETGHGIRILPVPARGDAARPDDWRWSARAVRRAIRDTRPDLIQVEEEPWTAVARMAAREAQKAQVPFIAIARAPWPERLRSGAARRRRRVLDAASALLATNALAANAARTHYPDLQTEVVPQHGVDVPAAPIDRSGDTVRLGFMGRLVPERGLDLLLRAVVRLGAGWELLDSPNDSASRAGSTGWVPSRAPSASPCLPNAMSSLPHPARLKTGRNSARRRCASPWRTASPW